jgi:hypothetical protein
MDVSHIILDLRKELARLDEAILALERLARDLPRRRRRSKAVQLVNGGAKGTDPKGPRPSQ